MAYTWTDGELITAEKLNNTGGGVLVVNRNETTLDKTWKEIFDAYKSGVKVMVKEEESGEHPYIFLSSIVGMEGNDDPDPERLDNYTLAVLAPSSGSITVYETDSETGYPSTLG